MNKVYMDKYNCCGLTRKRSIPLQKSIKQAPYRIRRSQLQKINSLLDFVGEWTPDQVAGLAFSGLLLFIYYADNLLFDDLVAREQRKELGLCEECGGVFNRTYCTESECPWKGEGAQWDPSAPDDIELATLQLQNMAIPQMEQQSVEPVVEQVTAAAASAAAASIAAEQTKPKDGNNEQGERNSDSGKEGGNSSNGAGGDTMTTSDVAAQNGEVAVGQAEVQAQAVQAEAVQAQVESENGVEAEVQAVNGSSKEASQVNGNGVASANGDSNTYREEGREGTVEGTRSEQRVGGKD